MIIAQFEPLMKECRLLELMKKGVNEGVSIEPHPKRPGVWLATSGTQRTYSDGGVVKYTVSADGCSCPAGVNGRECKHFAIALYTMFDEGVYDIDLQQFEMEMWFGKWHYDTLVMPKGGATTEVLYPKWPVTSFARRGESSW